jgi:hypothetical protein
MSQLLDPAGPLGICLWDEDVPCDVPLINIDTSGYAHGPACTISDFCDVPPVAAVPLPSSLGLVIAALAAFALLRRAGRERVNGTRH